jgi:hypothetical protein
VVEGSGAVGVCFFSTTVIDVRSGRYTVSYAIYYTVSYAIYYTVSYAIYYTVSYAIY